MSRKKRILIGWMILIATTIITIIAACIVSYPRINYPILISGGVLIAVVLLLLLPEDYLFCPFFGKKDKKVP